MHALLDLLTGGAAAVLVARWGLPRAWAALLGLVVLGLCLVGPASPTGTVLALGVVLLRWRVFPPERRQPPDRAAAWTAALAAVAAVWQPAWWPVPVVLAVLAAAARVEGRRAQSDEVDREVLDRFAAEHGDPALAPVAIVIAAYREADGLPAVLRALPREVLGLGVDVVVVDDGSGDGTAEAAEATGVAHVLRCPRNRGQGAALRLGYRFAREHGARYLVTTDADGQYDVADVPAVLGPVVAGDADFVTGSRVLGRQETHDRVRRLGVHVFAWTVTVLTGRRVTDTSFGLRAMRASLTSDVTLDQPQYQSSELLIGVLAGGARVAEVPATMRVRAAGSTKKGPNLVYGRRYAGVVWGTWWREHVSRAVAGAPACRGMTLAGTPERPADDHGTFLLALAVGVVVRVLTTAAFWPAFVISDGPTYLALSRDLVPSPDRVIGYAVALRALSWLSDGVWLVAAGQHVLGLVTATLVYALLRRRGCGAWLATLAALPILLDGLQLVMEHQVLSDELFQLLLVIATVLLLWRPHPRTVDVAAAGLVLGLAVLVRVVGEPALLSAVLLVVLVGRGWRTKVVHALLVTAMFAAPLVAYAAWYDAEHGSVALTQSGGRALYMRTTTFVDCARLSLPSYERPLCPEEPLGQRLDPTEYGWHDPDGDHGLTDLPEGVTPDEAMQDFALRAIRAQPGDYLRVVARDVALGFAAERDDRYEYDTADKWRFDGWYGYEPTSWNAPAYLEHGGVLPRTTGTLAQLMSDYATRIYVRGPVLAVLLLVGVAGLLRRPRGSLDQRPGVLLLLTLGVGLVLVPDATAQFVWRYTLPMLTLLPPAAALGWLQLRGSRDPRDAEDRLSEGRHHPALEHAGGRDHEAVVERDQPGVR